jgi:glycosyltransferase involved in cell wall biosynthesis
MTMSTSSYNGVPRVTVAVSAFNEAHNIGVFLQSVLAQKEDGFILERILVISDGSNDDTAHIVRQYASPQIEFREYNKRRGKSSRLNEIYDSLESDILVQTDADVIFAHPFVVRDIIRPISENERVWMTGGNPLPVPVVTFTERAVNCTFNVYMPMRKTFNGGNNLLSADGRLLAYRRELVKQITVPEDMFANDTYTFFCCLTLGHEYRYVETAKVYFRLPQTVREHIKQNSRFVAAPNRMSKFFNKNLVYHNSHIPRRMLLGAIARQFVRHPILCSYIFIVNVYCRLRAAKIEHRMTAQWDMAYTTKKLQ